MKFSIITTLSLELWVVVSDVEGSGLRVNAMMDVMAGFSRHWARTSQPMKPVQPVSTIFMIDPGPVTLGQLLDT